MSSPVIGTTRISLPATAQHFLGNSAAEAIPGDQEAQSASLAPVFQFGKEDDEFVLAALATPVLAFGKDQCSLAAQPSLSAVIQYRDVDFLRFSPDPPGDGESRNGCEQPAAQLFQCSALVIRRLCCLHGVNQRIERLCAPS